MPSPRTAGEPKHSACLRRRCSSAARSGPGEKRPSPTLLPAGSISLSLCLASPCLGADLKDSLSL
eukprot:6056109-Pyramimonas_sp.AAC.1